MKQQAKRIKWTPFKKIKIYSAFYSDIFNPELNIKPAKIAHGLLEYPF